VPDPISRLTRRALGLSMLAAAATPACAQERSAPRPAPPAGFRRGIGTIGMAWPLRDRSSSRLSFVWPPFREPGDSFTDEELRTLRRVGFDFVRLPVSPEIWMHERGSRFQELLDLLRANIERFRRADLDVIVNFHPNYNADEYNPERLIDRAGHP